ncbi:MAG: flagellar motor switch protein FliM [Kiritimatiellae bacterium]|nr:flagellar motor switch protein FliM [Kiritimatiellia bacterium]
MPEMLTQEEVDALLQAVQSGGVPASEETPETVSKKQVRPYDFRKPRLISNEQIRGLQVIHDTFAKGLLSSLSALLRTSIDVKLVAVDQLTYNEFILSLPNPTFITVVHSPTLNGNAILEMNLSIVMSLLDVLLGGDGSAVSEPRELTAVEMLILKPVIETALSELVMAWAGTAQVELEAGANEFNPEFVRVATPEASVVSITLDWRIGESTGVIDICYPYSVIQGVLARITSEAIAAKTGQERSQADRKRMVDIMEVVPLTVRAVLGHSKVLASELTGLNEGDILYLDRRFDEPVDVCIESFKCFAAEMGQRRGNYAVRLLGCATPREKKAAAGRVAKPKPS